MKKIHKKLKITIFITILCLLCIPNSKSKATTDDESTIRNKFVSNLQSYYSNQGTWHYNLDNDHSFYNLAPSAPYHETECVGWVSWAFKWLISNDGTASNITRTGNNYQLGGLVDPCAPVYINSGEYFDGPYEISSDNNVINESCGILSGDIVICPQGTEAGHVGIYIGNNTVMHFTGSIVTSTGTHYDGNRYFKMYAHWKKLDDITFSDVQGGTEIDNTELIGNLTDFIDLDDLNFNFYGNPQEMTYHGKVKIFNWDFVGFKQFIDYIIGIITYGVKAVIVGWTTALEKLVNTILRLAM